jgi:hypothetical protein
LKLYPSNDIGTARSQDHWPHYRKTAC